MAARLRAINRRRGFGSVGKRHLLHIAKVVRSAGMACLARTGTSAQAVVVIHTKRRPARGAGVAGVAVHRRPVQQLHFWNMVDRFRQGACSTLRNIAAVVAGLAG